MNNFYNDQFIVFKNINHSFAELKNLNNIKIDDFFRKEYLIEKN